jgi:hypothetical protein
MSWFYYKNLATNHHRATLSLPYTQGPLTPTLQDVFRILDQAGNFRVLLYTSLTWPYWFLFVAMTLPRCVLALVDTQPCLAAIATVHVPSKTWIS